MAGLPASAPSAPLAPGRPDRLGAAAIGLWLLAFGAILLGIRLFLIGAYGNATPFWDEWDAEASLYKNALEGRLTWRHLVAPHVVHRIFTWRLLALGTFAANGTWNPRLLMVLNSTLWAGTLGTLVVLLDRATGRRHLLLLLAFAVAVFALPFGSENTLAGFQGVFYFFVFWSSLALWALAVAPPCSVGWWGGVACCVLGFLSLGAGAFTAAAAAAIAVAQYVTGVRRGRLQLASIGVLAALFVVGVLLTRSARSTNELVATSLGHWLSALAMTAGWPLKIGPLGPLVTFLPAGVLAAVFLRRPPPAGDARWFLLAAAAGALGQAAAIAYGRAAGCLASRYLDLFAVGMLVNFACALAVVPEFTARRRAAAATVAWAAVMLGAVTLHTLRHSRQELEFRRDCAAAQREHVRAYLRSGDIGHLEGKPWLHVPYPRVDRLARILDDDAVRSFLPAAIAPPLSASAFTSEPREAFDDEDRDAGLPSRDEPCWTSHGAGGAEAEGVAAIAFAAPHLGYAVEVPVAVGGDGGDITLEVEQDGTRAPLPLPMTRGTWTPVRIKTRGRPFTLHVADRSPTGWVAVAGPVAGGRFDRHVDRLLHRWDWFVGGALVVTLALLVHGALGRTDA